MAKKRKKKDDVPTLVIPKNATLRQIYAIIRKQFTAADLQKFTVDEPMVPAEQVLAEMVEINRRIKERMAKAKAKAKPGTKAKPKKKASA